MKHRNPNDALFRLVKSMNQGEHRFFNMLCQRQSSAKGKVYLKLFEAIDKQTTYNEDALKSKFQTGALQFIETKKYLYKLLLDALVQHYRASSENNLHGKMLEIEVLLEKGLYDLCELQLLKFRTIAEEKNDFLMVVQTFQKEKQLSIFKYKYHNVEKLKEIRKKEIYYTELYHEVETYRELSNEIVYYNNEHSKTGTNAFIKIGESRLFKETDKPRSLLAKLVLHSLRAAYFSTLDKNESSLFEYEILLNLSASNPSFQKNNPAFVSTSYTNYISSCTSMKEFDRALEGVVKYKKFILEHPRLLKQKLIILYTNELRIHRYMGNKEAAIELIKEVNKKIESEELTSDLKNKLLYYFNVAFTYLDFGDYHASLHSASTILNFPNLEKTNFIYYYHIRIVQLFNLFGLRDKELLEYRLKAFHRFMLKFGPLQKPDKILIDFFHAFLKGSYVNEKNGLLELLRRLKSSLETEAQLISDQEVFFSYVDFEDWINYCIKSEMAKSSSNKSR